MFACTGRQSRASQSVIWPYSQKIHFLEFSLKFSREISNFLKKKGERWASAVAMEMKVYIVLALNLACTHVLLAAIRAITATMSTPQTLARKRSEGYALHLVAGADTTSSEEEHDTVLKKKGVLLTFCVTAHLFTDTVTPHTRCSE